MGYRGKEKSRQFAADEAGKRSLLPSADTVFGSLQRIFEIKKTGSPFYNLERKVVILWNA